MPRTHPTHELTAEREEQVDTDEYGSPIYETVTVVENEPVRYRERGTSLTRTETGERIERTPRITGHPGLVSDLEEGDTLTLSPIDEDQRTLEGLEVRSLDAKYGRGATPRLTLIELEDV